LLLAIAAFSLSLIGTFLVRSGVLSSVHSFANDPERGVFILALIVGAIGGALALFAWRAPSLEGGASFEPASRETALLLNNVFLAAAAATVFVGTLYPLALDALTGTKISVGPPYFAITFAPIFIALLILVPFGPRLAWKKGDLSASLRILAPAVGIAAIAAVAILTFTAPRTLSGAGAFAVAAWLITASILDVRARGAKLIQASTLASALAHAGLGVTLLGVAGTTLWRSEALEVLGPGESMDLAGYTLRLDGVNAVAGPNYTAARAEVTVSSGGRTLAVMHPEKRIYPAEGQDTVETAIRTTVISDLYLALGDQREKGHWVLRAYVNPLAPLIWLGALVMAAGGFFALWGRLRTARAAAAAVAAPAE
jgi:cytochrome c-type biogenesis protein CcmF